MINLEFYRRLLVFTSLVLAMSVVSPCIASTHLVINEVMVNEPGNETSLEWVELYNPTDDSLNLRDFIFVEGADSTRLPQRFLKSRSFAVLARKISSSDGSASFERQWGNVTGAWGDDSLENYIVIPAKMSLRNSDDSVMIVEAPTGARETVRWSSSPPDGVSLERINPAVEARANNFKYCKASSQSTPGRANSVAAKPRDLGFLEDDCEVFLPTSPELPVELRLAIANTGQSQSAAGEIDITFDRNFNDVYDPADSTFHVRLDALAPDSTRVVTTHLACDLGRQSIIALLTDDDDSSNNEFKFDFVLGSRAEELVINELMVNSDSASGGEWIECRSVVDYDISLSRWLLEIDGQIIEIDTALIVRPKELMVLCEDAVTLQIRYPNLTCPILQPKCWRTLPNANGSVILRMHLGAISDSVEYRGVIELARSWERDSDSSNVAFESQFYRSTDPSGATPCVVNSVRPFPVADDLAFVPGSLVLRKDSLDQLLIHATMAVVNRGYRESQEIAFAVYDNFNRDSIAQFDEFLIESRNGRLPPGDTASLDIPIAAPAGRHVFIFKLQDDELPDGNLVSAVITNGDRTGELIVTEFLADPEDPLESEWIEIRNLSAFAIDLRGWIFGDGAHQNALKTPVTIGIGEYFVIAQDSGAFVRFYSGACAPLACRSWSSLNNNGDAVVLRDEFGTIADSMTYSSCAGENRSMERNESEIPGIPKWSPSIASSGSTPCGANSIRPTPAALDLGIVPGSLVLYKDSLDQSRIDCSLRVVNHAYQLSPVMSIVVAEDFNRDCVLDQGEEFAQSEIPSIDAGDSILVSLTIHLSTGRHSLLFRIQDDEAPANNQIAAGITAGSLTREIILTEFLADPTGSLESEWIEITNISDYAINLSNWSVGDLTAQHRVPQASVLQPGEYRVIAQDSAAFLHFFGAACDPLGVETWASLNNDGDVIIIRDEFGTISDSASYSEAVGNNHSIERNESTSQAQTAWYPSTSVSGSTPCLPNSVSGQFDGTVSLTLLNHVFAPLAGEELHFDLECPPATKFTIEVFDLLGRRHKVIAESQYFSAGEFTYDGSSDYYTRLPIGAYILKIESDDNSFVQKEGFAVAAPK